MNLFWELFVLIEKENNLDTSLGRDVEKVVASHRDHNDGGTIDPHPNYAGSIVDVFVTADSINGKDATITISTSELPAPTASPKGCGGAKLQLGLKIDSWGFETAWSLADDETGEIVAERQLLYAANTEYLLPREEGSWCL